MGEIVAHNNVYLCNIKQETNKKVIQWQKQQRKQ